MLYLSVQKVLRVSFDPSYVIHLGLKFEITNVVFACFFYTNTKPDDEFLIDLSRYHVQFARFVDQIQ